MPHTCITWITASLSYIARVLPALFKCTDVVGGEAMVQLYKTRYQQCVNEGYTLAIIHQLLITINTIDNTYDNFKILYRSNI